MKSTKKRILLILLGIMPLTAAYSQNKNILSMQGQPVWAASFDSVGEQFHIIDQNVIKDSVKWSPQMKQIAHQMRSLWSKLSSMKSKIVEHRGMMNSQDNLNAQSMKRRNGSEQKMMMATQLRFYEMNQQMLSYIQGMQQMMSQADDYNQAFKYGKLRNQMERMMSQIPRTTVSASVSPKTAKTVDDGALLFKTQCGKCHGVKAEGLGGVFPPLNRSSLVQGNNEILAKIILYGLRGRTFVDGKQYNGIMPAFGNTLSDNQIAAIMTYIRSLSDNKEGSVKASEISKIRKVTASQRSVLTPEDLKIK